jgi:hypothetical protein
MTEFDLHNLRILHLLVILIVIDKLCFVWVAKSLTQSMKIKL